MPASRSNNEDCSVATFAPRGGGRSSATHPTAPLSPAALPSAPRARREGNHISQPLMIALVW